MGSHGCWSGPNHRSCGTMQMGTSVLFLAYLVYHEMAKSTKVIYFSFDLIYIRKFLSIVFIEGGVSTDQMEDFFFQFTFCLHIVVCFRLKLGRHA